MSRVKSHKAHTAHNVVIYSFSNFIGYTVVSHMSPPDEYVGIIKKLVGKLLNCFKCYRFNGDILVCAKEIRNTAVDTFGIYSGNCFIFNLVNILVTHHRVPQRRKGAGEPHAG